MKTLEHIDTLQRAGPNSVRCRTSLRCPSKHGHWSFCRHTESFREVCADEDESYLISPPPETGLGTWQEWQPIPPNWPNCPDRRTLRRPLPRFLSVPGARYFPQSEFDVFSPYRFAELSRSRVSDFNFIPAIHNRRWFTADRSCIGIAMRVIS